MDPQNTPDPIRVFAQLQKTALQAQEQFARASKLADFGATAASFQYLDRFIADYLRSGRVKPELSKVYHQAISSFAGACVIERYGGKWMVNKSCYVERRAADGALRQAHPFTAVGMALVGRSTESLQDWFFQRLSHDYADPQPAPEPELPAAQEQTLRSAVAPHVPAASAAVSDLPAATLEQLRARAEHILQEHDLAMFGYTAAAVACIETYLDEHADLAQGAALQEHLVTELGAFLGECALAVYGGKWQQKADGRLCVVALNEGQPVVLDPLGMVARRLKNGAGDDLHVWFTQTLPLVLLPASARMMMLNDTPPRSTLLTRMMGLLRRSW